MNPLTLPGFLQLKFGFPTTGSADEEYLRIKYLDNALGLSQLIRIDYKSTSGLVLDDATVMNLEQSVADQAIAQQGDPGTDPTNIYIQRFVDAYSAINPQSAIDNFDLVHQEFPKAYASLVQNMIDYIMENGIFDAATLQSLQLFHMNTNCPEDEIADLLDIQGILEQITREYAEQACNDRDVPLRDKFRRALKFGLMLLYIQLSISEFIVKNIFVFAAFTLDSVLNDSDGFLFRFFRKQVKQSLIKFLDVSTTFNPDIRSLPPSFLPENMEAIQRDLVTYFRKKIGRETVIANGGIRYTQAPSEVAFPPDTYFTTAEVIPDYVTGPPATFDDILDYLITERLFFSRVPINNALKKALDRAGKTPRSMNEALISSYPVLRSSWNRITDDPTKQVPRSKIKNAAQIVFGDAPNIFVLDKADHPASQPPLPAQRRVYSLWFYTGAQVGQTPATDIEPTPWEVPPTGDGTVVELLTNLYTRMTCIGGTCVENSVTEAPLPELEPLPPDDDCADVVITTDYAELDLQALYFNIIDIFDVFPGFPVQTWMGTATPSELLQLNEYVVAYMCSLPTPLQPLRQDLLASQMSDLGIDMSEYTPFYTAPATPNTPGFSTSDPSFTTEEVDEAALYSNLVNIFGVLDGFPVLTWMGTATPGEFVQLNEYVVTYMGGGSTAMADMLGITTLALLVLQMTNLGIDMSEYTPPHAP